ncbi:TadE family type IV pilus minor pilin, partial [Streptomyces diastaticus]|uniref:TadE family type IV pilus minor pilin n=1 Tax=Streptomyces diastaticus TaxID=1956 RepID=UPI00382395ED
MRRSDGVEWPGRGPVRRWAPATAGRAPGRRCRRAGTGPRRDGQRGAVTAETAVVLPTLVVFLLALLWALLAVAAHIQCVDAGRGGGPAAARPGPPPAGGGTPPPAAPPGADGSGGRHRAPVEGAV